MKRQLVLKEVIFKKKRLFKDELNQIIFSLDLSKYNKIGNKQFRTAQRLIIILYFRINIFLREF